jgi:hypothetical protein
MITNTQKTSIFITLLVVVIFTLPAFAGIRTSVPTADSLAVTITGDRVICDESGTTLTAVSPKAVQFLWSVGSVTPTQQINTPGIYTVTVTDENGNTASHSINVIDGKSAKLPSTSFCESSTMNLPNFPFDGFWTSKNPDILKVTSNNALLSLVAVSSGTALLDFRFNNSSCVVTSEPVTIQPTPKIEILGKDTICVLGTTNMSPSSGGTWSTSRPLAGTISNVGLATGVIPGTFTCTFTQASTGCVSAPSRVITVIEGPKINNMLPSNLCLGGDLLQLTINTSKPGMWNSSKPDVATIDQEGRITPIKQGVTKFYYNIGSHCYIEPVEKIVQNVVTSVTHTTILQNKLIGLFNSNPGIWKSDDEEIVTIINNQQANSKKEGQTILRFESASGCESSFGITVKKSKFGSNADISLGDFTNGKNIGAYKVYIPQPAGESMFNTDKDMVYPNPFSSEIYFHEKLAGKSLFIYHISGKLVWSGIAGSQKPNTNSWENGVYFLSVTTNDEVKTQKLIKF